MHQSPLPARSGPFHVRVRVPSRVVPVTDPYERCFFAVCAALKGQPGLLPALRAIVAARAAVGEARHV